jgi:GntR family transcriptional regulator
MNQPRRSPLLLQIATGDPRPINRQIVDGVKRLIASGDLAVGAGLPSVRGLAAQLAVNPNTVAKAYTELTTEGWLDARAGLGLFVATPRQRLSDAERERRLNDALVRFVGDIIALDYPTDILLDRVAAELALCAPKQPG